MPNTTGETLSGWQELASSLSANAAEVPHLEGHRTRLADLLKQAQDLTTQQAALTASKQEVSKKLQGVMDEGKTVASFLRAGVRQHFGKRAEKMVEFGMRPFRGLRRKTETDPSTPETKPPAVTPPPAVNPAK
ncbi:MAG: hypothetical protein ACJ76N_06245 [Thermoanaerobaculia bacterium]